MNEYVIMDTDTLTPVADMIRSTTGTTSIYNANELSVAAVNSIAATHIPEDGRYIRLCCSHLGEDSVIALNEEII